MMEGREPLYYHLGDRYGWLEWTHTQTTWGSKEDQLYDREPLGQIFIFKTPEGKRVDISSKELPRDWKKKAPTKWRSELVKAGAIKVRGKGARWLRKPGGRQAQGLARISRGGRSREFCPPGCIVPNPKKKAKKTKKKAAKKPAKKRLTGRRVSAVEKKAIAAYKRKLGADKRTKWEVIDDDPTYALIISAPLDSDLSGYADYGWDTGAFRFLEESYAESGPFPGPAASGAGSKPYREWGLVRSERVLTPAQAKRLRKDIEKEAKERRKKVLEFAEEYKRMKAAGTIPRPKKLTKKEIDKLFGRQGNPRKKKSKKTKKRRKNYAVSPSELVPIIKRWAKSERCDGDLVVMTGRKWTRDVKPTDADVIVCCRSKLLRAIRKQGDVMEEFSELIGEHGYSYIIKGDEIRIHSLGINPEKAAGAIARGFGAPTASHGALASIHDFKEETKRQRKALQEKALKERRAAKKKNPKKKAAKRKTRKKR